MPNFWNFLTEDVIDSLTLETNMYAFLQANAGIVGEHSRFSKWNEDRKTKMVAFLVLTYYVGTVKKDLITSYLSIDSILSTPFPRTVMSRKFEKHLFRIVFSQKQVSGFCVLIRQCCQYILQRLTINIAMCFSMSCHYPAYVPSHSN